MNYENMWNDATNYASDFAGDTWEFLTPSDEAHERMKDLGDFEGPLEPFSEDEILYEEGRAKAKEAFEAYDPDSQFGLNGQDYAEIAGVVGQGILAWNANKNKQQRYAGGRYGTGTSMGQELDTMYKLLGVN